MEHNKFVSAIVGICGGISSYLWGGWDTALKTLLLFMLLDYILGTIRGAKDNGLSSEVAFKGILKKITVLIIITVGVNLDTATDAEGLIRGLVLFFYIAIEGISILENATEIGVPIPNKLKDMLAQLKDDKNER